MLPNIPQHPTTLTDKDELREMLASKLAGEPQRAALASTALNQLFDALAVLASLGHKFSLAHEAIVPDEFPKMLYHEDRGELTVMNAAEEAAALRDGWVSRLAKAPAVKPAPSAKAK